jgi:hypothetical protein
MAVNKQWATRPEDETFDSLQDAYLAAKQHAENSVEKADVVPSTLRLAVENDAVVLVGKGDKPAHLSHWAFGQVSSLVGAPASYLRNLPATLATQNLNYGFKEKYGTADKPVDADERVNLLIQANGGLLVRSVNSDKYSRIWNYELLERCMELIPYGWTNPRPFNTGDKVGTVWVSDHDMFVFQTNDENLIQVPGEDRVLRRGYIMSNSEVGAAKWKTMTFLFDYMCCNRMIWGATQLSEISVRHVGSIADRVEELFQKFSIEAKRYAESSGVAEEAAIEKAMTTVIADTKEGVIEKVFKVLRGDITKKAIEAGYDTAVALPDTNSGANSVWGLSNGLTRWSQTIKYTDERMGVDRAAGKLIELANSAF